MNYQEILDRFKYEDESDIKQWLDKNIFVLHNQ